MTKYQKDQVEDVKSLCKGIYITRELKKHGVVDPADVGVVDLASFNTLVDNIVNNATILIVDAGVSGLRAFEASVSGICKIRLA